MSRERVSSPSELRPGDRIEVAGDREGLETVLDLLFFGRGFWQGVIVAHPPGMVDAALVPMAVGNRGYILQTAYGLGRVFIRRRSREDHLRALEPGSPEALAARIQRLIDDHAAKDPPL